MLSGHNSSRKRVAISISTIARPQRNHESIFSESLQSFPRLTLPTKSSIRQVLLSAAELMKLSFLWICYIPTQHCWNQPTNTLLHLWVYSAPLTDNILRSFDACSSFKNSHVSEKLTVSDTLQVPLPYSHSSWWPHLFPSDTLQFPSNPLQVSSDILGSHKTFSFPLLWGKQETAYALTGLKPFTQREGRWLSYIWAYRKDNGWMTTVLPWGDINQAFGKFPPDFMKFIKMVMPLRGFPFFPDWLKFADSLKSYVEEWGGPTDGQTAMATV